MTMMRRKPSDVASAAAPSLEHLVVVAATGDRRDDTVVKMKSVVALDLPG